MLRIHQVFILKFLLLFGGTIFISFIISYSALKSIVVEKNTIHLQKSVSLINLNLQNVNDLDIYAKQVSDSTGLRVTIIDIEGVVIAESNTDKNDMDNHANRYEIQESNEKEFSFVTRYSDTLKVDFLYMATKSRYKNEDIYIRVSMSLGQVMSGFYTLWYKLAAVLAIITMIAFYISRRMSRQIVYDIKQITNYLDEISDKNYNAIIKTRYFHEFLQISLQLKNLVKKLSTRDKQKRKYTAKLRLINKQRNDILSAISHEFKNPIASIIGYAQTIQEDEEMDNGIRNRFLQKISSNGSKISQMLDRLALSVKLDNNDLDIKESKFDLKLLCDDVAVNLSSKFRDRNIVVKVEPTALMADKTMIEIVLVNLVDNALKYSEGDVKVLLKGRKLSVIDSGIGIKEKDVEKVTSKFYRVDKNTWDNSMGLGLAMVSYILKLHHTTLEIESEYGEGTTMSFSIKRMLAV